MTAIMDSPDRNLTVAAADSQGSPLFNYLCTLSPIKPVKSGHVVQTFSELSFPPPPTVFISPRLDTKRDHAILKRMSSTVIMDTAQAMTQRNEGNLWFDTEKSFLSHLSDVDNRKPSWNEISSHHLGYFESTNTEASAAVSTNGNLNFDGIPSKSETVLSQNHTPGLSAAANPLSPLLCDIDQSSNDWDEQCNSLRNVLSKKQPFKGIVTCQVHPSLKGQDWLASGSRQGSELAPQQGTGVLMLSTDQDKREDCSVKRTESQHQDSLNHGNGESLWELDQPAPSFAAPFSTRVDKSLEDGCKLDSQLLQKEIPTQHRLGFSTRFLIKEDVQTSKSDAVSLQSSSAHLCDHKADFVLDIKKIAEPQTERGQQSWRANISGVPRRCLDFETTEALERNKRDLSKLKLAGFLLEGSLQCASSNDSNANKASVLLHENTCVLPDGIDSRLPQILKHDSCTNLKTNAVDYGKDLKPQSEIFDPHFTAPISTDGESLQCTTQLSSPSHSSGISPVPVGAPSGIGLHLNSLGGSIPASHTYNESRLSSHALASCSKLTDSTRLAPLRDVSTQRYGNCIFNGADIQSGSIDGDFGPGLVVSIVEKTRMHQYEVQSAGSTQVEVTKSTTCIQSVSLGVEQLEGNPAFGEVENRLSSLGGKRVFLQDIPQQSEFDHADDSGYSPNSPKRKRISILAGDKSGDGCKRCNCKKSKCLKLYCECFSAGVYCADPCSCHNCFNKPEFEETVLGTRQQIESRNPLAFAPKIILASDLSPANGEECVETPASARHKRGCHCKKSQCLKKYCECYQAGVGCADGCKCDGCKNIFGRKEGSEDLEDKEHDGVILAKESTHDHISTTDLISVSEHQDNHQQRHLSPITPSFDHSGSTLELRSCSGSGHCPPENLSSPFISIPAPILCRSRSKLFRSLKGEDNTGPFLSDGSSPACTSKFSKTGQFSPSWDGFAVDDISTLTPLPHPPLRPIPVSTSFIERTKSRTSVWQNNDTSTTCSNADLATHEMSPLPAVQPAAHHAYPLFTSSVYQFQAPDNDLTMMTPMQSSSSFITAAAASGFEEHSGSHIQQSVWSTEENDTPNVAKDSNGPCASAIILKTRSPQQKRVSPRQQTIVDTTLRDMMSRRKFILQAMPSFPSQVIPAINAEVAREYLNQP